ncbi:MAG: VWA domain-containing protein [bacterium]
MLTFLNPLFLLGLLGASIPIIIHVVARRRIRKIQFSSLMFLRFLEGRKRRRFQLQQLLLLALRILIIAFFSLALARPTLKSETGSLGGFGERAKTTAIFIIDVSYSMGAASAGGKTAIERAKETALKVLESLKEGDRASLILASLQPEIIFDPPTFNLAQVAREIKRIEPGHTPGFIAPALNRAYQILQTQTLPNAEIYILSDGQKKAWEDMAGIKPDPAIKLFCLSWPSDRMVENAAIVDLDIPTILRINTPHQLGARIKNFDDQEKDLLVSLYLDGDKRGQRILKVDPKEETSINFYYTFQKSGEYTGYFALKDDALALDNIYPFSFRIPAVIKVLTIGPEDKDTLYLNYALRPAGQEEKGYLIMPVSDAAADLARFDLSHYDLIALVNLEDISAEVEVNLTKYLEAGGGLLIFLGGKGMISERLSHLLPAKPITVLERKDKPFTIVSFEINHYIFNPFKSLKRGLEGTHFYQIFEVDPLPSSRVLAKFNEAYPAIIEGKWGKGRTIMVASSGDISWNDLPLSPFYLPLMHQLTYYLNRNFSSIPREFMVGDRYELPATTEEPIIVIDPEGEVREIKPIQKGASLAADYGPLNKTGIYQVNRSGDKEHFTARPDFSESDLSLLSKSEVKEIFKDTKVKFISSNGQIERVVYESRQGRELGNRFLGIVLGLLLAEGLLSNRFSRPRKI